MKPTYYYTLYPDTFLWINETEGVMYNAKEHTYLSFDIHGLIKKYCLMLNELRNLYTIEVHRKTGKILICDHGCWIQ